MSSRGISTDEVRRRAQQRTDKAEKRRSDAVKSMNAQDGKRAAIQLKTAKLRALRLAKEAAEAAEVAEKPAPKPRKSRAAAASKDSTPAN